MNLSIIPSEFCHDITLYNRAGINTDQRFEKTGRKVPTTHLDASTQMTVMTGCRWYRRTDEGTDGLEKPYIHSDFHCVAR